MTSMARIFFIAFLTVCVLSINDLAAQQRIVVMGSSTSFGAATTGDSAWVNRMQGFYRQNTTDGLDTTFSVVGGYGWVTYFMMPTGYIPPAVPVRPPPSTENVTKALSLSPNIVIINLPSNDINAGYAEKEVMDNLRFLVNYIKTNGLPGVKVFVTTTQPRNDMTDAQRQSQRNLVDSTFNNFGIYAIDFWTDLVTNDGMNQLKDDVRHLNFPDAAYHLNGRGHQYIYFRARNKNIFDPTNPLPLKLIDFKAEQQNENVSIEWTTVEEDPNTTFYIERSETGTNFQSIQSIPAKVNGQLTNYQWLDRQPLPKKSFYRLKIEEPDRTVFSLVKTVNLSNQTNTGIQKIYTTGSLIIAETSGLQNGQLFLQIIGMNGQVLYKSTEVMGQQGKIVINPGKISHGQYILNLSTRSFQVFSKKFNY